jgi:hypothetical protein
MTEWKTPSALVTRDLDGIYLRVQIEGKWDNRCLTDLIWEDVDAWLIERLKNQSPEDRERQLRQIAKHFHERLRSIGDQLNLAARVEDDGPDDRFDLGGFECNEKQEG